MISTLFLIAFFIIVGVGAIGVYQTRTHENQFGYMVVFGGIGLVLAIAAKFATMFM